MGRGVEDEKRVTSQEQRWEDGPPLFFCRGCLAMNEYGWSRRLWIFGMESGLVSKTMEFRLVDASVDER